MRRWTYHPTLLVLVLVGLALRPAGLHAANTAFTYQGRLDVNGQPVTATCNLEFALYDAATGGNLVNTSSPLPISVSDGFFTAELDYGAVPLGSGGRWMQITADCPGGGGATVLSPRQKLTAAPYAHFADTVGTAAIGATQLQSGAVTSATISDGSIAAADIDVTSVQRRVTGTCAGGNAFTGINSDGSVLCTSGAGDITAVTAGTGLTGGGTTGAVTVNLAVPLTLNGNGTQPNGLVVATNVGTGSVALRGQSSGSNGRGVHGLANTGGMAAGVLGESTGGRGVEGRSTDGIGVFGRSTNAAGVYATSVADEAIIAYSETARAGFFFTNITVQGVTNTSDALVGQAGSGVGVRGMSGSGAGIRGTSSTSYAGYFDGKVHVAGQLTKASGAFRIDHPLDPANQYLQHSFVESPDMKNIYDGVVVLDAGGEAVVRLPAWFESLNRDFRYQLTCIGAFAPVYVAGKIHDNEFRIAGGPPGLEVSWQVTGIRHDPYAVAHPIIVELDKPPDEIGGDPTRHHQ